ncbi:MAG TPA: 2-dehydro-3-deoxy-6-phosphogalactonate aldolase [Steroidobacteraceae bacterium]
MRLPCATLWEQLLAKMPLIAILRGIRPREAVDIAEALSVAGFLCVEVPLNSPDALESISALRRRFDGRLLIGAGTVLTEAEVAAVQQAGAQIAVSPNTNPGVIAAAKGLDLICVPGFATATEALAGAAAGADALKLFPAESASAAVVRALKAVLPASLPIFPVGGITAAKMAAYISAGAAGFGIGSALYTPGASADIVGRRAAMFVKAWRR